ncbi:MAG: hypothetical protein ACE5FB_01605 [Candidatus Binatia bacterium]
MERILWERVERINERLEHYEKIRKVAALQRDFPDKIRIDRKAVADIYQKKIEEITGADE